MPFAKYAKESATDDEGGKSEWWSEKRTSWYEGGAKAEGRSVNPLVEKLLGSKPKDGTEVPREILASDPNDTWYQNSANK